MATMIPEGALFRAEANSAGGISFIPYVQPPVEPPPVPRETTMTLAWGNHPAVDQDFRDSVCWIGLELAILPSLLMSCMAFETIYTFDPKKRNKDSGATGLIQWMNFVAKEYGVTTAELAEMTAVQQLGYVYRYFQTQIKRHGPIVDLADCYMAIFAPSAIGKPLDTPLYTSRDGKAYLQNKGLDVDKDGRITKGEAAAKVQAAYDKGMRAPHVWTGVVQPYREVKA